MESTYKASIYELTITNYLFTQHQRFAFYPPAAFSLAATLADAPISMFQILVNIPKAFRISTPTELW